jgi:hypothetical protein
MLTEGRNGMETYKMPLKQGNKRLYKVNGKVRLATEQKAKEMKDLGLNVSKVTQA